MSPLIENPKNLDLPPKIGQVLHEMFAGYRRIVIRREFGNGLSGGRVFEVRPIQADGTPELPTVAKLAAISLIQNEWRAYQQYIRHRLPNIAELAAEPVLLPEIGWGGLRYTLMGGSGTFEVVSLRDYCRRPEVTVDNIRTVLARLVKVMHQLWGHNRVSPEFHFEPTYSRLLPVNLLIKHPPSSSTEKPYSVSPESFPLEPLMPGTPVRLAGFVITKVDLVNQTVTLSRPKAATQTTYYLRVKSKLVEQMATYQVNQVIDPVEGEVLETRHGRLQAEIYRALGQQIQPTSSTVLLPDGTSLPNPLAALSTMLNDSRDLKIATIHGDFNLENILIEPQTGAVSLIDFGEAREDHVLHDCLRLETEVVTKLIPEVLQRSGLPLLPALAAYFWQLHCAAFEAKSFQPNLLDPDLEKPIALVTALRRAARKYLFDGDDASEYYQGLVLYLLGALKFKNLDASDRPLPKQVAFWAAVLAYQFLTTLADQSDRLSLMSNPPPGIAQILSQATGLAATAGEVTAPDMVKALREMTQSSSHHRPLPPEIDISIPNSPLETSGPAGLSRDSITVGHITGGYVAIGPGAQVTVNQRGSIIELDKLFESLYSQIRAHSEAPFATRIELTEIITSIKQEVAKGRRADAARVERWLDSLIRIAPDISKATAATLLQPNTDIHVSIRRIAAKIIPDTK